MADAQGFDPWALLDTYFRDNAFFITAHHLLTFNEFLEEKIRFIIKSMNPIDMLKNDPDTNEIKLVLKVYVGGKEAKNIYKEKPTVVDSGGTKRRLFPNEARLKNLDYKADLYADVLIETFDYTAGKEPVVREKTIEKVHIGSIPIMVGSVMCNTHGIPRDKFKDIGECMYDQGGYFIVSGNEKVIIAQERNVTNVMYITDERGKTDGFSFKGVVRCTTEESAIFPKKVELVVLHPNPTDDNDIPSKEMLITRGRILASLPNVDERIPLFILFRALGVTSDKNILACIVNDIDDPKNQTIIDYLFPTISDPDMVYTQQNALMYIGAHMKNDSVEYVKHMIFNDLFPNLNPYKTSKEQNANLTKKAMFLGRLTRQLVRVCIGLDPPTERDHYGLKRVDVSGFLCANIFRDFYNRFRREVSSAVDRSYLGGAWEPDTQSIVMDTKKADIFQSSIVTDGMMRSLRGKWGVDELANGVSQELSRLSFMGFLSHLRRVKTPLDPTLKVVEPRRLHSTQWGAMCPTESPDGGNIGLIKHLAMLCHITLDRPGREVLVRLDETKKVTFVEDILVSNVSNITKNAVSIYVNNNWIGFTDDPDKVCTSLRQLRRKREISVMTSVLWDRQNNQVVIFTDGGRCCRPLLIVEEREGARRLVLNPQRMKDVVAQKVPWQDLMKETANHPCAIEYIDVSESNGCLIAMTPSDINNNPENKYTHCEIHPTTIFAVLTANIPFSDHNMAPRNYFSGAQGKQAVGVYNTQFNNRMDIAGLILHYPQKAIVNTKYMEYLHNNELPNGENAIVAIMCYSGYNQEDSMIINRGSIEKGMFNMTYYKTIVEEESFSLKSKDKIVFANPLNYQNEGKTVEGIGKRFANYAKLDEHGFPIVHSKISLGDVYLGMVSQETVNSVTTYRDKSIIADKNKSFTVDKVFAYSSPNKEVTCKIRGRIPRMPTLGDKVASRHAQKGVVGAILQQVDMPFTKDGLIPDIIMNPHAIPTRMTVGHLLECVFGKIGCKAGEMMDATPFGNRNLDKVFEELENRGYQRHGDEILYNGITGEQIKCEIFIGPTYMLRLKHMVSDKINYRAQDENAYTMITRQPVASRGNEGGLKLGEMENNCINSHGMQSFVKESMFERSDRNILGIDKTIGDVAIMNFSKEDGFCKPRGSDMGVNDFDTVAMPFATKQFLYELQACALRTHIYTDTDDVRDSDDTVGFDPDGGGDDVVDEEDILSPDNEESSY
jgi:DNA-directed RNA polymerase II subunit RPB2